MPFAVRVRLSPIESGLGQPGQRVFDGAQISLVRLGPTPSRLEPESPLPATLSLHARFIESVRRGGEESRLLATLDGEILLGSEAIPSLTFRGNLGPDGEPLGLTASEKVEEDLELPEDDPREIRLLRFAFDTTQFKNVVEEGRTAELLTLIDAGRFDYCEISASLSVSDQTEAPDTAGEVLDILITDRNPARQERVTVRLTDELGDVMPGAAVRLLSGAKPADVGADPNALVADGNGEVRLKTIPGAAACELSWGSSASDLRFRRSVFLDLRGDVDESNARRLRNLGYTGGDDLEEDVLAFQADVGSAGSGRLHDIARDLVALHDEGSKLGRGEPLEPRGEPIAVNGPRNPGIDDRVDRTALA